MASGGGRERWGLEAPGVGWGGWGEGGNIRCTFCALRGWVRALRIFDGWLAVVR